MQVAYGPAIVQMQAPKSEKTFHDYAETYSAPTFSIDSGFCGKKKKKDAEWDIHLSGSLRTTRKKGGLTSAEGCHHQPSSRQLDRVTPCRQKQRQQLGTLASKLSERAARVEQFVNTYSHSARSSSSMSDASSLQACSYEEADVKILLNINSIATRALQE